MELQSFAGTVLPRRRDNTPKLCGRAIRFLSCPPPVFRRSRGVIMRPALSLRGRCGSRRNLGESANSVPQRSTGRLLAHSRKSDGRRGSVSTRATQHSKLGAQQQTVAPMQAGEEIEVREKRRRAQLLTARRPAAAPRHGPALVARGFALTVFASAAANANRKVRAKRSITR